MIKIKLLLLILCFPLVVHSHSGDNNQDDDDTECENTLKDTFPEILKPYAKLECDQFIVNTERWQWRFPNSYFDRPYIPAFAPKSKKNVAGMRVYKQFSAEEIDKKEISYGTIGPTLWNYGKLRGYSNEVVTYTWNRINNSKAYNACSNMPRFAHFKLLNEQQIQDVMALLLDPASPVNQ